MFTIAAILLSTWYLSRFLRTPRVFGEVPLNADQRIALWTRRLDEEIGALTEERFRLAARGAESKRRILARFRNPSLPDTVWRVGRQPLRKLSRHERFVGPAAEAAERGLSVDALVGAMAAALTFDDPEDAQSVDLQRMLREMDADSFTATVTELDSGHPLFAKISAVVAARQSELSA
jgi:mannitol-1-phosphate 5-dehydrogenase